MQRRKSTLCILVSTFFKKVKIPSLLIKNINHKVELFDTEVRMIFLRKYKSALN